MYSWEIATADNHGNGKDICPEGFHVPTALESYAMRQYIDSNSGTWIGDPKAYVSSVVTSGELFDNCARGQFTDPFNFSFLPGGYWDGTDPNPANHKFEAIGLAGYYWETEYIDGTPGVSTFRITGDFGCETSGWGLFSPRLNKTNVRCLHD